MKSLRETPHTYDELITVVDNLVTAVSVLTIKIRDIKWMIKDKKEK